MGRETNRDHKHNAEQTPGNCALAPALEHRGDSNEEQQDCTHGHNLVPHEAPPSTQKCDLLRLILQQNWLTRSDTDHRELIF